MNIVTCIEEYILDCTIRNLTPQTLKRYRNNDILFAEYVKSSFGITDIEQISIRHIKKYMMDLRENGRKITYINSILKNLKVFFEFAYEEHYISTNIMENTPWMKEEKPTIKTFTDDEVRRMMKCYKTTNYLDVRNRLILALVFDTGLRCTELISIQSKDIHDKSIYILGKGRKYRHIPKTPMISILMRKYEHYKDLYFKDNPIIFPNYLLSRTGRPLTVEAIEHIFREAGKKAGVRDDIRCSPHTGRHYYAQASLRNGLDLYSLSRVLGHESVVITKRYLQSIEDTDVINIAISKSPLSNLG